MCFPLHFLFVVLARSLSLSVCVCFFFLLVLSIARGAMSFTMKLLFFRCCALSLFVDSLIHFDMGVCVCACLCLGRCTHMECWCQCFLTVFCRFILRPVPSFICPFIRPPVRLQRRLCRFCSTTKMPTLTTSFVGARGQVSYRLSIDESIRPGCLDDLYLATCQNELNVVRMDNRSRDFWFFQERLSTRG